MFDIIEFLAVMTSAAYGNLLARRKRLDFVGVFSVAFIVSFGGGTLRDVFLDRHPLFWIASGHYPVLVFALSLLTACFPIISERTLRFLHVPDALGLGLFGIVGAEYAVEAGTPLFVAALLGVITGTFGGVMGDVICNEIPSLFRPAPLYATCAFTGAWCFLLMRLAGVDRSLAAWVGITVVVAFRLAALRWDLRLPTHAFSDTDAAAASTDEES